MIFLRGTGKVERNRAPGTAIVKPVPDSRPSSTGEHALSRSGSSKRRSADRWTRHSRGFRGVALKQLRIAVGLRHSVATADGHVTSRRGNSQFSKAIRHSRARSFHRNDIQTKVLCSIALTYICGDEWKRALQPVLTCYRACKVDRVKRTNVEIYSHSFGRFQNLRRDHHKILFFSFGLNALECGLKRLI